VIFQPSTRGPPEETMAQLQTRTNSTQLLDAHEPITLHRNAFGTPQNNHGRGRVQDGVVKWSGWLGVGRGGQGAVNGQVDEESKDDIWCVNTYTHTHAHAHANAHTHTHTHTLAHALVHVHACMHAHMHNRTRTHTHIHTHSYVNMYGHTDTY